MPTYPDCSCAWKVQDPACPYHGTGAKPAGPAPYPPDDIPHHVNEHFAAKVTERDNSIYDDAAEYLAERDALIAALEAADAEITLRIGAAFGFNDSRAEREAIQNHTTLQEIRAALRLARGG